MSKITLEDVKDKAVDLAQAGLAKSSQVAEMAKLQINTATEQETIKKLYLQLGKRYYQEFSFDPGANYEEACVKITEAKQRINENTMRIKELRNPDIIMSEDKMPKDTVSVETEED